VPNHRWSHRRIITRRYFTESWKTITRVCPNHRRIHRRWYRCILPTESPMDYPHPEVHACQMRARQHTYRRIFRPIEKVWRDFRTFLVRISTNFRRYYWRNLMPSTTINVCRKNCYIKHPLPPIWFIFFLSAQFLFFSISLLLSDCIWFFEEILLFWW